MKNYQKGFTLIELVVVLGILATLSGTILFTANGLQRRNIENAAIALQADLRHAQRMAVIEGRRWHVLLNTVDNSYSVGPVNDRNSHYIVHLPNGLELSHTGGADLIFQPRGSFGQGRTINLHGSNFFGGVAVVGATGRSRLLEIERTN
ncbi:MAG: type II secretion system GspH family protein [Defluviitaleaceae bacterium]|nr:type II secretion system GspH family protein [Defluviitaleaceae bacterium]